jgi:class 3 adenylate cyclase/Tfp pilus assembly protein PilF
MKTDLSFVDRIRSLLQRFGWETGLQKLQAELDATDDDEEKETLRFFAGWMAAERGAYDKANELFGASLQVDALEAWSIFGQAFVAFRQPDYPRAHELLEAAEGKGDPDDLPLSAGVAHLRGAVYYKTGDSERALHYLREALKRFGKDSFATGRVLDTFGMVYASRDNFHAAEEFFGEAIRCKQTWNDQAGLALSFGNLGRLYLDWGYLDQAERYFHQDLAIANRNGDARSEAAMHGHLGQAALERGERAAAQGRLGEARRHWADAAAWLDSGIQRSKAGGWTVIEGYVRKDRALLALAEGKLPDAQAEVERSRALFLEARFNEGLAHADRTLGMIMSRRGAYDEASRFLRAALGHFEHTPSPERVQVARTLWEMARVSRAALAPQPEVKREYLEALDVAERSRRAALVRKIEEELKDVDSDAYLSHIFYRVRGHDAPPETYSLISGVSESLTVLFLDVKGSTDYAREVAPEMVMMTLNQMMANMTVVLRDYDAVISGFRGDGFMALFRGPDHASRAVEVALDIFQEMKDFNEPRTILGKKPLEARIGISTGGAVLGNVGTYDLMDFTAIGTTANLGARLESAAEPGYPCISQQTHFEVGERFLYRPGNPRTVVLKGLGTHQVWDVDRRATARPEALRGSPGPG